MRKSELAHLPRHRPRLFCPRRETSVGRRREFSALVRQYHPPRRCRIGAAGIQSRCGEVGLQSPDPVQPSSTWAVREAKPSPEDKAQARMPRAVSRSPPPFRRRRSPSPRYTSRRNRRDRSRSPYSSRYLPPYPSSFYLGFLLSELRLKEGRYCLLFCLLNPPV